MISRLVLFLLLITLVNCSLFNKCCDSGEGLIKSVNSTEYNCSSNFKEYVLPLQYRSENLTEIPNSCEDSCIDKTVEGTDVIKLSCDFNKISSVNVPTIYKCCPLNMVYNINLKSCVNDTRENTIFDSSATIYNLLIGVPECLWATVDYTYEDNFIINNGTLTIFDKHNETVIFENGQYCVDKSTQEDKIHIRVCQHISLCKKELTCIAKCCPLGFKMYKAAPKVKSVCIPDFSIPFYQNFTGSSGEIVGIPANLGILPKRNCLPYRPPSFIIFDNGTAKMGESTFTENINKEYCIEYFVGITTGYHTLMCFPQNKEFEYSRLFYLAGLIISIIFLAITVTIYFFLPDLQNLHGKTLMSHTTALLAAFIFLATVTPTTTYFPPSTCIILAYAIMYSFLVAFAWLNVLCFDIWFTFGVVKVRGMHKKTELKKFLLYSLYAYGLPLIHTGIALYVHFFTDIDPKYKPTFGVDGCWFSFLNKRSQYPHIFFFSLPVGVTIFINIIFFTLTVRHCLKVRIDIQRMQHADSPNKRRFFTDKATLIMNLKLFIVMGMGWVIELISMYQRQPEWLWYILDPINILQGLWIFFIFVLKENVWKALKKKLGCQEVREASQTQSTALTAKLSVTSATSIKINGISKPEERELLETIRRHSSNATNGKQVNTTVI